MFARHAVHSHAIQLLQWAIRMLYYVHTNLATLWSIIMLPLVKTKPACIALALHKLISGGCRAMGVELGF